MQVIDLPAASVRANSLYLVNVSVSKLARGPQVCLYLYNVYIFFFNKLFPFTQPYALVISGQNTYLDPFYEYSYSGSTRSSTYISTGAYPYIAVSIRVFDLVSKCLINCSYRQALSAVAALIMGSVWFFRKLIRNPDDVSPTDQQT